MKCARSDSEQLGRRTSQTQHQTRRTIKLIPFSGIRTLFAVNSHLICERIRSPRTVKMRLPINSFLYVGTCYRNGVSACVHAVQFHLSEIFLPQLEDHDVLLLLFMQRENKEQVVHLSTGNTHYSANPWEEILDLTEEYKYTVMSS
uniref:Uncharacterized protein n=1 Tax=Setaria digitata TaxID=48799 RepID=A0A915Q354_9BILA